MVSEISGIADLFFVCGSMLLATIITKIHLKNELLKHMGPVEFPKSKV